MTPPDSAELARELRRALVERRFDEVLDRFPVGTARRDGPRKIHQTPNVDVVVIVLSPDGRPVAAANVLLSPRHPDGVVVPLDDNLSTDRVRWRCWDDAEWDHHGGQGSTDLVAGRQGAPLDFMSPYPASVLKLMVGYGVLRLVDQGRIALDQEYTYRPTAVNRACGPGRTGTVAGFFDEMITVSGNPATCALIKLLHDHRAVDGLNRHFADLGLSTLRLAGTDPGTGGTWDATTMNALDTAKLLLAVNGGAGTLWTAPDGAPVTREVLSDRSRAFFLGTLAEQGLNQVLSTTNWCGRGYPAPGIPQLTADRWIDPEDGTMTVDGRYYGRDVRPCQQAAEVTFAHKTGYVDTSGNDAGIVKSLPGKPVRNYVVAVHSNLGDRYVDPDRPADPPGVYPVAYTQKYAQLGLAIDRIVTGFSRP